MKQWCISISPHLTSCHACPEVLRATLTLDSIQIPALYYFILCYQVSPIQWSSSQAHGSGSGYSYHVQGYYLQLTLQHAMAVARDSNNHCHFRIKHQTLLSLPPHSLCSKWPLEWRPLHSHCAYISQHIATYHVSTNQSIFIYFHSTPSHCNSHLTIGLSYLTLSYFTLFNLHSCNKIKSQPAHMCIYIYTYIQHISIYIHTAYLCLSTRAFGKRYVISMINYALCTSIHIDIYIFLYIHAYIHTCTWMYE